MNDHDPDDDRALENDPLYFTTGPTRFQTPDEYIASTIAAAILVDERGLELARSPYMHGHAVGFIATRAGRVHMCWLITHNDVGLVAIDPRMDNRDIDVGQRISMMVDVHG